MSDMERGMTALNISPVSISAQRFNDWADVVRPQIEVALAQGLDAYVTHAVAQNSPLVAAMRHGVMNGGKRVRALAVLAAAHLVGGSQQIAMQVAVALEYIHAYSLIHDDLPCMDDDDLRRGQPTVHIQYGQAQALLAGDALQTLAFDVLASERLTQMGLTAAQQLQLIRTLARASGVAGMAGGQAIDCHHVGQPLLTQTMQTMHSLKTGALLHASVMMGAMCVTQGLNDAVNLSAEQLNDLSSYADDLGLLFQVVDDILDASQDTATLGKTAGKDADANKPTYVQAIGINGARDFAQKLYASALTNLNGIASAQQEQGAQYLADLASYCHERIY
ncbi:MAG: Farnesyl diphosphate synthase [Burkholderiaceae bacterium]|nr:Farnesyl diphosphate synthase [Burkholderiaceae bacterium]